MKKQLLLAFICFLYQTKIVAQLPIPELPEVLKEKPKQPEPVVEIFFTIRIPNFEFPDGNKAFQEWFVSKIKHPKRIKRLIKTQRLSLFFLINTDGSYQKTVGKGMIPRKIRRNLSVIFNKMPRFKGGFANGRVYRTWFFIDEHLMCHAVIKDFNDLTLDELNTYRKSNNDFIIKENGIYWQQY